MKKITTLSSGIFILIFFFTSSLCQVRIRKYPGGGKNDNHAVYRDGIYTGMSRGEYIYEPYWGISRIKIENGLFSEVNFMYQRLELFMRYSMEIMKSTLRVIRSIFSKAGMTGPGYRHIRRNCHANAGYK